MTLVYHLCGYEKTAEQLAEEHAVPARLLPIVRTLFEAVPGDRDLVLPYELSNNAALTLAEALGLTIEPSKHRFYFEASDASDTEAPHESAATAR